MAHGWEVLHEPRYLDVTVPRGRRLPTSGPDTIPKRARIHYQALTTTEREALVTAPIRTLIDCSRVLPFAEALAVTDSALRRCTVDQDDLIAAADAARGPGSRQARTVARLASPEAMSCFESLVRAIALGVPGLQVVPQVRITVPSGVIHVDLADERLRIVIEADSFAFHGTRTALANDARRYNWLTCLGWRVVRVTWEEAVGDPAMVRGWLAMLVAQPPGGGTVAHQERLVHRRSSAA